MDPQREQKRLLIYGIYIFTFAEQIAVGLGGLWQSSGVFALHRPKSLQYHTQTDGAFNV